MADPRRNSSEQRRTGWVWVIVGIVAVALVVWWVAAAVDGGEDEVSNEEMAAVEQEQTGQNTGELGGEQVFGNGEGEVFEDDEEQAQRSGQLLGETPADTQPERIQVDESGDVQQYTQWSERQAQAQVDAQSAQDGLEQLDSAIGALIDRYSQPQEGEQVGGGPTRGESNEVQQHREELDQAIQQLEEAQQQGEASAFHEAANTAAQTLQTLQRVAELDQLDQPVEQLQQQVHQIQVDQPLSEQSETVRGFFDQSAQVVEQMSQSLGGSQTGGGPTEQQQRQ